MLVVHKNGSYESSDWLSAETYPDSHFVDTKTDEGKELASKVVELYPFYQLVVEDGVLIDVEPRDRTPEEIEAENAPSPKTAEQIRIEQLEGQLAAQQAVIDALVLDALGGGRDV
ncbi:hypothetical protein AB4Z29_00265 [Paenibacillus sp. 2TAB23]|uniref:hypothetical protein n=1 Tax=Paenibacillus sp. 2TAB23 TaxID=3233004 RepID=UPI003F97FA7D